jgi:hypothetical protein|eukprot:scaffold1452_cov176-Alexandrium_tamarense.AAC.3
MGKVEYFKIAQEASIVEQEEMLDAHVNYRRYNSKVTNISVGRVLLSVQPSIPKSKYISDDNRPL